MDEIQERRALIALERIRGESLINKDWIAMKKFIARDLVHIHSNGKMDGFDDYFDVVSNEYEFKRVERGALSIVFNGDTAIMTGPQTLEIRPISDPNFRVVNSHALQIWFRRDGGWQQVVFQATNAV